MNFPYEELEISREAFEKMYRDFYRGSISGEGTRLIQKTGDRYLVVNPPGEPPSEKELDHVFALPYERKIHPLHVGDGKVRAIDTVQFSITTHRGCFGECNFCAIAVHQGRLVISRSEESILREVREITQHPDFRGIISDVGGPTANMYRASCPQMKKGKTCIAKRCLFPSQCPSLESGHDRQIQMLRKIRNIKSIKKAFVASGIRYDMVVEDKKSGTAYLEEVVSHHVSGQLRVAPEHVSENVLKLMGKPGVEKLHAFADNFKRLNEKTGKKQFLSYYYIAAHPGCSQDEMQELLHYFGGKINHLAGSVQIFTPTPSTWSTLMYYTGRDPFSGRKIFVESDMGRKKKQQQSVVEQKKEDPPKERLKIPALPNPE